MRLAYEVTGDGAPLVLIHGITDSRHAWDPLIPALAADHTVIAVDLRGHGQSERVPPYDPFTMANDIGALLADAGITEPLVVGHSLGGVIATVLASEYSTRAVVNVDQPLELGGFKEALASMEPMLRGDDATFHAAIDGLMDALAGPLPADERARIDAQASPEQDVVLGIWGTVFESSAEDLDALFRDIASRVTVPYLTILGNEIDGYESWLKERIPTATVEAWPGTGHFLHLVERERFVERVRAFERTL